MGGSNAYNDVRTVQYLLNCVPQNAGGPAAELAVDGIAGPLTKAAIKRFQQALGGVCDGRVDPRGGTLAALAGFDPYPNMPMPAGLGPKMGGSGAAAAQAIVTSVSQMIAMAVAKTAGMATPDFSLGLAKIAAGKGGKGGKLPAGMAGKVAETVRKAAEAAAKAVEHVAKSGKKNPGKKFTGALHEAAQAALEAAKRVAEAQAKLEGIKIPSGGLEFPFLPGTAKGGGMGALIHKIAEIAKVAQKTAEGAGGKMGKVAGPMDPFLLPGGDGVKGGMGGVVKGATEAAAKAMQGTADAATKAAEAAAKAVSNLFTGG